MSFIVVRKLFSKLCLRGLTVLLTVLSLFLSSPLAMASLNCSSSLVEPLHLEKWLAEDVELGVPENHRRRVIWATEPGKPTELSVLMVHGLYNSPAAFSGIHGIFTRHGMNVIMSRLNGHQEINPKVLSESIQWQTWYKETERELQLALTMGRKVVLVGHSTGGLLATWLAIKYPESVAGLVIFAPAFGVHRLARIAARVSKIAGVHLTKVDGRVLSGHAGTEVVKAGFGFKDWLEEKSQGNSKFLEQQLENVPIWMGNTQIDIIIRTDMAHEFMQKVIEHNPRLAPRQGFWIPASQKIVHDQVMSPANPNLSEIKDSLEVFLITIRN